MFLDIYMFFVFDMTHIGAHMTSFVTQSHQSKLGLGLMLIIQCEMMSAGYFDAATKGMGKNIKVGKWFCPCRIVMVNPLAFYTHHVLFKTMSHSDGECPNLRIRSRKFAIILPLCLTLYPPCFVQNLPCSIDFGWGVGGLPSTVSQKP